MERLKVKMERIMVQKAKMEKLRVLKTKERMDKEPRLLIKIQQKIYFNKV